MSETLMPKPVTETINEFPLPLAQVNAYTNQQLIDAFFDAANQLHAGDYQGLLARAELDLLQLAADRNTRYTGQPLASLPHLSAAEKELIHQGLLRQLQRRSTPGKVNADAGLNLRAAPGRTQPLLISLPDGCDLVILSEIRLEDEGTWLLVTAQLTAQLEDALEQTGWVFAELVSRQVVAINPGTPPDPATGTAPTITPTIAPTTDTSALEPTTPLDVPPNADPHVAGAAATWNRYGGLIERECTRLAIDPAVAVAILGVESSGRAFEDNRMVIRFENHIFLHYWGAAHRDLFDRHFTGSSDGSQHRWRPDPNGEWQPCHTSQATEWQVLELARSLDEQAALYSISMGAGQIMGFNHAAIGYSTVQAMFAAFQADVRHQLTALFRFIEVNHLQDAVRIPDFVAFARTYNGHGQETIYAPRLQRYYDAYRQLAASRGEAVARLPQPGVPTLFNGDPKLLAAWRKHVIAVFDNNETVFHQLLDGFLRPYWTTVWMYRILFALGVLSFVLAAGLAISSGRVVSVFTFGGLSAIAILGYFFNRPLQALEQNLQFLTWLGIIYNSYWTRLTLLNNEKTVQQDIDAVTDEATARIQELVAEHAKRSKTRTALRLPFGKN